LLLLLLLFQQLQQLHLPLLLMLLLQQRLLKLPRLRLLLIQPLLAPVRQQLYLVQRLPRLTT
jgi:hypothetical protein